MTATTRLLPLFVFASLFLGLACDTEDEMSGQDIVSLPSTHEPDVLFVDEPPLDGADATVASLPPEQRPRSQHQNANLYAFWSWGGTGFWNVDQHLYVSQKAAYTYWAQYWTWANASYGGYAGLQTNGNRFNGTVGDTAIFSLWNANGASGPSCGTFGGEGVGYSCRIAYAIQTGRYYRTRIWRLESDALGQWWGAWVKDESSGVETYIGKIRVAPTLKLMGPTMNFSEYFGPAVACGSVPVSIVYWTQPAANSQGNGVYQYGSAFSSSSRGACTGGSVQSVNLGWTKAAKITQGGQL